MIVPFAEWGTVPKAGSTLWETWEDNPVVPSLHSVILKVNSELAKTDFAQVYEEEMQAAFVDAFNLLYVAFTRPESKLYVISKYNLRKDGELKDIANLLTFYVGRLELSPSSEIEVPIQVDSEAKIIMARQYVLKEDYAFKEKKKKEEVDVFYPTPKFLHTQCRDLIRVRRNEGKVESKNDLEALLEARKQGVMIHYAFEKIRYREDIPKAIQALVSEGKISIEEVDGLKEQLNDVMNLPEIKRYFTKGIGLRVFNEKEVLLGGMEGLQTLRPDRIVFDGDKLIIMDYKTGAEDIAKHKIQLRGYAFQFQEMGYTKQELYIIYTEGPKAVRVS